MRGILALFIRSLRETIRGASFAWMRAGMATIVLITLMFFKGVDSLGAAGMEFFPPFAVYNACMIAVAAMSYFASAITEEKEEQTLGLLRMTDLSALAILFGKSTSRILSGIILLAVQFPFALLSITLGGMTWEQIAIVYVLLCAFLIFAANLGLLASVLTPTSAKAALLTGFAGFFYLFPKAILAFIGWIGFQLLDVSIPVAVNDLADMWGNYSGPSAFFETLQLRGTGELWKQSTIVFLIAATVCFALAWMLFGRFARDEPVAARRTEKKSKLGWLKRRAGRTWADAVAWKDFHFIHGGWRTFWLKFAIYVGLFALAVSETPSWNNQFENVVMMAFAWGLFVLFWELVISASRIYRLEQRGLTLGSLYVLPQDIPALQRSKRRALLIAFIPVGCFLLFGAFFGALLTLPNVFKSGESFFVAIQIVILLPLEVVFHYRLVCWLSMRLKWGGIPATLAISFFGHMFLGMMLALGAQLAAGIPFILILSGAIAGLKRAILRHIEANAALG